LLLIPAFVAGAQSQANFAAPSLGFIWDPAASAIRTMPGVPGAAAIGGGVELGFTPRAAAVSPRQDFALAASSEDGQVRIVPLNGEARGAAVSGALHSPDRMLFSPSGHTALLYSQSAPQLQILSGLPANPVAQNVDASAMASTPAPLAISDDGALLLADRGGSAWLLAPDSPPAALGLPAAAASFRRRSRDALLLSPGGDVYWIQNRAAASGVARQVRAGDGAAGAPVAIQFSRDGAFAYAAFAAGIVLAIHLETGEAQPVTCSCAPTALEPLKNGALFRVTDPAQPPVWLFDSAAMRFLFVPQGQQAAGATLDATRSGQ
jgi:hypothetical protein